MAPSAEAFAVALRGTDVREPDIAVIGNVSAQPLGCSEDIRADLEAQIRAPVRWYQSLNLLEAKGVRAIELGPGRILTAQLKRSNQVEAVSLDGRRSSDDQCLT
jgi:[acyl-carrier-protein] S-malonyltransferase